MRPALAALGLVAMIGIAVIVTSQIGGLDRREFDGLMGAPAPEQVAVSNDPDDADLDPFDGDAVDDAGSQAPAQEMPPAVTEVPTPEPAISADDTPASDPDPTPAAEVVAPAVRNVTAPGMTPAPVVSGPLEREALPKKPPTPPRWKAYSPVVVREAGLLDIGPRNVRLAGIVAPTGDQLCHPGATGDADVDIACSRLAMVALRSRIRAFGVECRISENDTADPVVAPCRIGPTDLALWLVEQGWAEAARSAPKAYAAAEKEARCARRGLWKAASPPADCFQN